jgi:hypothetical protein
VITYRATLDVPAETLRQLTIWLLEHRRRILTPTGSRAAGPRAQALLVLRWFRDDTRMRLLALDAGLPISTAYRYLHEGIDVLAARAPELHQVLARAKAEGWSHVDLDGTLIETDRVRGKNETGYDAWYSGKHEKHGGNVHVPCDPTGFPVWTSPVEPARSTTSPQPASTPSRRSIRPPRTDCPHSPTRATPAPASASASASASRSKAATWIPTPPAAIR